MALGAWVALMLATWLVYAYGTDQPLKGSALVGAGFVYGVLVLGVAAVAQKLRAKKAAEPKKPQAPSPSRKKRR